MGSKVEKYAISRVQSLLNEKEKNAVITVEDIREGKKEAVIRELNGRIAEMEMLLTDIHPKYSYKESTVKAIGRTYWGYISGNQPNLFTALLACDSSGRWEALEEPLHIPTDCLYNL